MKMSSSRFQETFTALTRMKTEPVCFHFLKAAESRVPYMLWLNNLGFPFEGLNQSHAFFGPWLFLKEKQEFYPSMTTLSNLAAIHAMPKGDSHCVRVLIAQNIERVFGIKFENELQNAANKGLRWTSIPLREQLIVWIMAKSLITESRTTHSRITNGTILRYLHTPIAIFKLLS